MSFSSRRRNYFLTPHRRDGLIEWMKSMLMHSFVLDALATTGADTFSHFEELINEHREVCLSSSSSSSSPRNGGRTSASRQSRLQRLVPTVGVFHTPLPLRRAYEAYNAKYKLDRRRHLAISFNEIRHILNLAQIMAFCDDDDDQASPGTNTATSLGANPQLRSKRPPTNPLDSPAFTPLQGNTSTIPSLDLLGGIDESTADDGTPADGRFCGPSLITFDGDQTLYSDGANFESNPKLATYLYLLLRNGVTVAVVTAAGYEYQTEKYELRLSGLLQFFRRKTPKLTDDQLARFYLFGGECNYLLRLGKDYKLHPVNEHGAGGWMTATRYLGPESPANWPESDVTALLDLAEESLKESIKDQNLRARFLRKKRSVGLVPGQGSPPIPREALDETVLRAQDRLDRNLTGKKAIPYCAFNGGRDVWVDVGNKRVGVRILQSYLGVPEAETLHIGDQFLNTGNDYAARQTCPCIWITNPDETTYILKSILRLAGIRIAGTVDDDTEPTSHQQASAPGGIASGGSEVVNFDEMQRRTTAVATMDVYTGELTTAVPPPPTATAVSPSGGGKPSSE
mmetsp:Transcript_5367/g.15587  ORF Transcript_5367/g.15587 Transcript_5367/m.15587 type:complete len:569 (+) Transcript_5367:163-1869(+)